MVGPTFFNPGSFFDVQFDPATADRVDISGALTIGLSTTLALDPQPGTYIPETTYIDFSYLHENGYREHGAETLSLEIGESNARYWRLEGALEVSLCTWNARVQPTFKFGVVGEWRPGGSHLNASFPGIDCEFTVSGIRPKSRVLFAPGFRVTGHMLSHRLSLIGRWDGEFGRKYVDNQFHLQAGYSF